MAVRNEQSSHYSSCGGYAILMGEQGSRGEPKLLTVFAESELYSSQSEEGVKEFSDDPKAPDRTDRVLYGDSDVSIRDGRPGVLISLNQANQQGWSIGDPIGLISAPRLQQALTSVRPTRPLMVDVRGFTASHPITGEPTATLDMGLARRLLRVPVGGTSLDIRLHDYRDAQSFVTEMAESGAWPSDNMAPPNLV